MSLARGNLVTVGASHERWYLGTRRSESARLHSPYRTFRMWSAECWKRWNKTLSTINSAQRRWKHCGALERTLSGSGRGDLRCDWLCAGMWVSSRPAAHRQEVRRCDIRHGGEAAGTPCDALYACICTLLGCVCVEFASGTCACSAAVIGNVTPVAYYVSSEWRDEGGSQSPSALGACMGERAAFAAKRSSRRMNDECPNQWDRPSRVTGGRKSAAIDAASSTGWRGVHSGARAGGRASLSRLSMERERPVSACAASECSRD